ncbi:MAG: protein translocase SEC61 complex subunit gamma [Candidatus Woesearchaeota archaeon]
MAFKEFVKESKRVFRVTKKPDKYEFRTVMKVAGLGILMIGLIGFILNLVSHALQAIGL